MSRSPHLSLISSTRSAPAAAALLAVLAFGACTDDEPDELILPGDNFYPESLSATADGTLYVGSVVTGEVVRFPSGSSRAEPLVAAGARGTTGVLAHDASGRLFTCAVDAAALRGATPTSELRVSDLRTGELQAAFPLPTPSFCNDLDLDAAGNLYVSDSLSRIYRLAPGATALAVWSDDPLLAPSTPSGFGVDGIAIDGDAVYANTFSDGRLVRIPITADGSAGPGVSLMLDRALGGPDGMRRIAAGKLVVINGRSGELLELAVAGDTAHATVVATGLLQATSVIALDDDYWVTEGQVGYLLGTVPGTVKLPFRVLRVDAGASSR